VSGRLPQSGGSCREPPLPGQQIVKQPHRRFRRALLLLHERARRLPHPRPLRRVAEQRANRGVQLRRVTHLPRRPTLDQPTSRLLKVPDVRPKHPGRPVRRRPDPALAAAAALQVCADCRFVLYPPRDPCPKGWSARLPFQDVPADGTLLAETTIRTGTDGYFRERTPWRIGTVALDCGPSFVTHLHGGVTQGDRVLMTLRLDKSHFRIVDKFLRQGSLPEQCHTAFVYLLSRFKSLLSSLKIP